MPTSTRVRALLGAAVLGGGLVLAPGLASAQTPTPSCADYPNQTDAQAAFVIDRARLAPLDPDANGMACEELPAVSAAVALAGPTPTTTTAPPTTTSEAPTTSSAAALAGSQAEDLLARIATLQCGSTFNTDYGAIIDDIGALAGDARFGEVLGASTDRVEELNYCLATTDEVVSTIDDGSVPITDGGQVTVIPEGSAETGEA